MSFGKKGSHSKRRFAALHPFRADLHCHSSFSDGTDTPEALIDLALEKGLSGLSITDHDTLGAYPQALDYAQKRGLLLLPGIEFSAYFQESPVHILAYAFRLKSEALLTLCGRHRKRRFERNLEIVQRLKGLGIHLGEIKGEGRPHIALALIEKGVVGSIQEAFDRFLGDGKPAFCPGKTISVEETLEVIHRAGGRAVIAHPHLIRKQSLLRRLSELPFDGIEGYYAKFSPERERKYLELGRKKEWLITGGSDYHGTNKPFSSLGSSWVDEKTFYTLYDHFNEFRSQ